LGRLVQSADLTYLTPDTLTAGLDYIDYIQKNQGRAIELPIASPLVQDYCPPVIPGHIMLVVAQSHNGKTEFLEALAKHNALRAAKHNPKAVVAFVHLEENIQDASLKQISRLSGVPMGKLARGEVNLADLRLNPELNKINDAPIARIAVSMRTGDSQYTAKRLYRPEIHRQLKALESEGWEIVLLIVDYLTALPTDAKDDEERRLKVREDLYEFRDWGNAMRFPVASGSQAKQKLEGAPAPGIMLPGLYDITESKDVAERSDRVYTFWMPKTTNLLGKTFDFGKHTLRVTNDLILMRVCKQKGGLQSGRIFICRWNYATGTIELHPEYN